MIVVDSSAIIAIRGEEPSWELLVDRLTLEPLEERHASTASFLEAGTVIAGRLSDPACATEVLEEFVEKYSLTLLPVDEEQIRIALEARIRYGRGFGHPAKLNFGDCFSYALAKTLRAPLLYTGDDFTKTDIRSALKKRTRKK